MEKKKANLLQMPETLKVAELVPALKKHDADHEQFSNFRPISNLVMVSKVIEKDRKSVV